MKLCKDCKIEKEFSAFYGKQTECKLCTKIYQKLYYKNNKGLILKRQQEYTQKNKSHIYKRTLAYQRLHKEKHRLSNKKYYLKNKDKRLAYQRQHRKLNIKRLLLRDRAYNIKNKEKRFLQQKLWISSNRGRYNASKAKRRAIKLQRTTKWLTITDFDKIKEYYIYANLFSKTSGIQYDVDHIIPLQGKNISGLHVPENLTIITAIENDRKGNRWPYKE